MTVKINICFINQTLKMKKLCYANIIASKFTITFDPILKVVKLIYDMRDVFSQLNKYFTPGMIFI